jgi:hypothetical protein
VECASHKAMRLAREEAKNRIHILASGLEPIFGMSRRNNFILSVPI